MTLNFLEILIKLALGLFSLVFVINVTGKGNLAPNSAIDQIQNYVLGGIIGGAPLTFFSMQSFSSCGPSWS